jgi:hypothetical protein
VSNIVSLLLANILLLVVMVGIFTVQQIARDKGYEVSAWVVFALVIGAGLGLYRKFKPKDPSKEIWKQFRRDRITETTHRAWWQSGISLAGSLLCFLGLFAQMLFAMFIVMTSGDRRPLVIIFLLIFAVQLIGQAVIILSRRHCVTCRNRLDVIHDFVDGESDWLVCHHCQYRAIAPSTESETSD